MRSSIKHYKHILQNKKGTRFASCGYSDRFDPFLLNKAKRLRDAYDRLFKSFLSDIPHARLLDVGCGTGIYFDTLVKYADEIEAVDASDDMISVAREYCKNGNLNTIHLKASSGAHLHYEDCSFDIITALDVLHHAEDLGQFLSEVHRLLKRGGYFFVFEPNTFNPLVFLGHAIAAEERLALQRNNPGKLISLLEERFDTVRWTGVCEIITQLTGIKRVIADLYLKLCLLTRLERCFPRQAWLGIKR